MGKCRELNAEIVANAAKVSTALKLSQEDQTTISSLKKVVFLVKRIPLLLIRVEKVLDAPSKLFWYNVYLAVFWPETSQDKVLLLAE